MPGSGVVPLARTAGATGLSDKRPLRHAACWWGQTAPTILIKAKGIDKVKAKYGVDVMINGNQCFANNGVPFTDYPYPFGMTNQCDGRLLSPRVILRPPSNDSHHALGGAIGRRVLWTVFRNRFSFGAEQIPDPWGMDEGLGGLSNNHLLPIRQTAPNQAIGRGTVHESGKGIISTATNYVTQGGKAEDFATDAHKSGVQPLNGGDADDWELLFLVRPG